jgi:hypothetical protein
VHVSTLFVVDTMLSTITAMGKMGSSRGLPSSIRLDTWNELREKLYNRVFKSLDALEEHLAMALKSLEENPGIVCSIVSWPWIVSAFITSFMK